MVHARVCAALLAALLASPCSAADVKSGAKKAALCELCHKVTHPMQVVPLLDGQPAAYLYARTKAFKEKRLPDPVMQTNVATLSDRDMRDIAQYFSTRTVPRNAFSPDTAKVEKGKSKLATLDCTGCHGERLQGSANAPRLAGQAPAYVIAQLELLKAAKRDAAASHAMVAGLTGDEIEMLAYAFATME